MKSVTLLAALAVFFLTLTVTPFEQALGQERIGRTNALFV